MDQCGQRYKWTRLRPTSMYPRDLTWREFPAPSRKEAVLLESVYGARSTRTRTCRSCDERCLMTTWSWEKVYAMKGDRQVLISRAFELSFLFSFEFWIALGSHNDRIWLVFPPHLFIRRHTGETGQGLPCYMFDLANSIRAPFGQQSDLISPCFLWMLLAKWSLGIVRGASDWQI